VTSASRLLVVVTLVGATGTAAAAQPAPPAVPPGEVTVSAGFAASGGYAIGDRLAELRSSRGGGAEPFTLFRAESAIDRAAGVDVRLSYAMTSWLAVEVGGSVARPRVSVTVTGDTEALTEVEITERISEYAVGASGLVYLPYRFWSRSRPYVIGGVEYLRQLHGDRLLVETGRLAFAGGGVRYWLRGAAGSRRALGLRGEVRLVFRTGGIDFEDRGRRYPRISALGFIGF
jgi:opacity protein-like surface antigen